MGFARRRLLAGIVAVALLALTLVLFLSRSEQRAKRARAMAFDIVLLDDRSDPFVGVSARDLAPGMTIEHEELFAGSHAYVAFRPIKPLPLEVALSILEGWTLKHAHPPAKTRLVWGVVHEPDVPVTLRSYLLTGEPDVTKYDVVGADPKLDDAGSDRGIIVSLTQRADFRLTELTRAHMRERLAILLEGVVHAAPRIASGLDGGGVFVSMQGATDVEINGLAAGLRGDLRRGP